MLLNDEQRRCTRCGSIYEWRKSSSRSLKLTYCTFSCERISLGFLLEDLDAMFRRPVVDLSDIVVDLEGVASSRPRG